MSVTSQRHVSHARLRRPLLHVGLTLALLALSLGASRAPARAAATATLTRDINQIPSTTRDVVDYTTPVVSGSHLFFTGSDRRNGRELWVTEGDAASTHLVRDLTPGPASTIFVEMVSAGAGRVFFTADSGLWQSDGTAAGTQIIAAQVYPQGLRMFAGSVYYVMGETTGYALWKSDGTAAGTQRVKQFGTTTAPHHLVATASRLFFIYDDGAHGRELWTSDGTEAGTTLVTDITPSGDTFGQYDSRPLTVVGNRVFFVDDAATRQLWRSDGTPAGTTAILSGVKVEYPTAVGSTLFFRGMQRVNDSGDHSIGIWRSDGTTAGTYEVKSFYTGTLLMLEPRLLVGAGNKLFFQGTANALWVSDGTTAGTVQLAATSIIDTSGAFGVDVAGRLFFRSGSLNETTLWVSDGTPGGTHEITRSGTGESFSPESLVSFGGKLFFQPAGAGLWRSDGTSAGTQAVLPTHGLADAFMWSSVERVVVDGRIFFVADDGVHGNEVWTSDGTAAGTFMLKDISPDIYGTPFTLTNFGGALYFLANDGSGMTLWTSDGTSTGTVKVRTFDSGHWPLGLRVVGSRMLFFTVGSSSSGDAYELWQSDGTAAGTGKVANLPTGTNPTYTTALGSRLFFVAYDGDYGREPWVSDGTAAGTHMLKDIDEGWFNSAAQSFTDVAGTVFFSARTNELWKTDGTTAGTVRVKTLPYVYDMPLQQLTAVGSKVFFSAYDTAAGVELWTSDGTEAGTTVVKDINTGPDDDLIDPANASAWPGSLANADGTLLFTANDGAHGRELWRSDGTAAGTTLVTDLNPGRSGSGAANIVHVGNGLAVLSASDGMGGVELWQTRGTAASTTPLAEIAAGPGSSNPYALTLAGSRLFFVADDGVVDKELWSLTLDLPLPSASHQVFLPVVQR